MEKRFTYMMLYNQDLNDNLITLNAYGSLGYKVIHIEKVTDDPSICNILLMKEE